MRRVQRHRFGDAEVDEIDGIPWIDDAGVHRRVRDGRAEQAIALRNEDAAGAEETIAHVHDGGEVFFEEWKRAGEIGDDDVDLLRQLHVQRAFLEEADAVGDAVSRRVVFGDGDDVRGLDGVDACRAELAREDAEGADAGAKIEHDRRRRDCGGERASVRLDAAAVGEHRTVVAQPVHRKLRGCFCSGREGGRRRTGFAGRVRA
ncbi:MAG TPA: hypothetical protein VN181_06775 [Thermoanaerobaculia bacterium]|nr:hypothetical protein [Thermoanaerobaculia bacterium]